MAVLELDYVHTYIHTYIADMIAKVCYVCMNGQPRPESLNSHDCGG